MQGQERDVIIVSTAASDPGFISHLQDFLYLPARLNVAVSRARTKVIVMASDRLLQSSGLEPEIQEAVGLWRSLRAASYEVEL
jgi:DNA replication ATP-dependent helicase Dna2